MVEFRINIEKKHAWLLALLILAVGLVIAQQTPNPGHDPAEITDLDNYIDQRIAQSSTSLTGQSLTEWKKFTLKPQQKAINYQGKKESLASMTTIYGRSSQTQEQRGCEQQMLNYCQAQGYSAALPMVTSCGWSVWNDRACPDHPAPGCLLHFYCLKTKK